MSWGGKVGNVYLEPEEFQGEVTVSAALAEKLRGADLELWLQTSWEGRTCSDRHNDEDVDRFHDKRRLL